ncbi:DUF397 domain-containing protein [Streptomyces griseoviridis]
MPSMENWRTSSHSGPDDGNNCVEIASTPTHVAVRDTKARSKATLTFPVAVFLPFLGGVKGEPRG